MFPDVSEPLPPIFGSQLCYESKRVQYISRSLPNLSTLVWIKVSEEETLLEAAEQALNAQYDRQVAEFYENARNGSQRIETS